MSVKETDIEQSQTHETGLAAVGASLAEERNKRQLSLESVATDLHLRPDIVEALESGDQAKLPATAFVRGYVKSYARLLGLDETGLVSQLPQVVEHRPTPLGGVGVHRPGISLPVGKWLVWVFALAALALMLVYGMPALERLWSARTVEPESNQLLLPQSTLEQGIEPALLPVPEEETPASGVQEIVEPLTSEADIREPVKADPEVADPDGVTEPATAAQQPEEQVIPTEPQQAQKPAGPALVQMRFLEDSWVEMEAHGRKLVVGTQNAGSERTVSAEPPIHVLLGNAPGVELSYRGEAVDLTPYRRGKVARLTLED